MNNSKLTTQQHVKKLLTGIQQDYQLYTRLLDLLTSQRSMIIERRSHDLQDLNQEVTELYNQLSGSARERMLLLKMLKVPTQDDGIRLLFSRFPEAIGQKAHFLWDQLEQKVIDCKQLNERNAQLLMMQQEIFNRLLNNQPDLVYHPSY